MLFCSAVHGQYLSVDVGSNQRNSWFVGSTASAVAACSLAAGEDFGWVERCLKV